MLKQYASVMDGRPHALLKAFDYNDGIEQHGIQPPGMIEEIETWCIIASIRPATNAS